MRGLWPGAFAFYKVGCRVYTHIRYIYTHIMCMYMYIYIQCIYIYIYTHVHSTYIHTYIHGNMRLLLR